MIALINRIILFSGLFVFSQFPQLAFADSSSQTSSLAVQKKIEALPPVDVTASLLSMFKALAICIALLLFVVWVLKKVKSPIVTGQGRVLRIIERLPVSAKSSLLLVEVNKKKVLIGVGSDPVNLISDFVDSESLENIPAEIVNGEGNEKQ